MNFNKKSNIDRKITEKSSLDLYDFEKDGLNIKEHLNESLDLSGIQVSEDLINRTLKAIKQQEAVQQESDIEQKQISKKRIPWSQYTRVIAGAAAAILVVTVGLHFAGGTAKFSMNSKGTNSTEQNGTNDRMASDSSGATTYNDGTSSAAGGNSQVDPNQDFAIADNSAAKSGAADQDESAMDSADTEKENSNSEDGLSGDSNIAAESDIAGTAPSESILAAIANNPETPEDIDASGDGNAAFDVDLNQGGQDNLSFRDVFLANPEEAKEIRIINEASKSEIILTHRIEILKFYMVMDQQLFIPSKQEPTTFNYTIVVTSLQAQEILYTMVIGDIITVSYATGDTISESIYTAKDQTLILKSIDEFYQSYSK